MLIHSPIDIHLGCLPFLTTVNNAAMENSVYVFVWIYVPNSLVYIPSYGIAGLYGNCLLNYFFTFYSLLESPAYLEEFF